MRLLPDNRRATVALVLLTAGLAVCLLQFTLDVSASLEHFA
jgi:hypothetical protein